ncbi:MAG: homocysteine S-methyltransferase family protein [Faecalicoccus sp.]|nr:homocysteine S-methyltransferase family protein [Faecalicoccus sp.]
MKPLKERLGKEWLFCDGAAGTILQAKNLKGGELPETWNLTRPDDILDLYCGYLNVGSNIFNTNTFGANSLKFPFQLKEIVEAAIDLAKEARVRCNREDAYIALDIGPTGKLLQPMGDLPFEMAVKIFSETIKIGAARGVDLILIETMSDSLETKAAILAAKETCDLPIFVTNIYDARGKLLTGGSVESTVAMLEGLGVDALGVNCGLGPEQMIPIVKKLTEVSSIPIIVNPNAGLPRTENGKTIYDVTPEQFAATMSQIADMGVQVVGGCCGTTPEHIRQLIDIVKKKEFKPNSKKNRTFVSSYSQAVEIGVKPVIIGERINPTGKKLFKQALRDHNIEYIVAQGLSQEDAGAHILDVNVGLPEIDEVEMMETVVTRLQSVTGLPLQIDTSDIHAMEKGMRIYNGKPMINSVNGKKESMDAIFPLVKKYGGVVVALLLDENGIPDDDEGRIQIAKKIYQTADEYGIDHKDIVFDGLAMAISSNTSGGVATLNTIRRIKEELHGYSILGVSNISFGLPHREIINSNFFTMAILNGLNCAIINPQNEPMMRSYRASLALLNMDEQCMDYIEAYADVPADSMQSANTKSKKSETSKAGLRESVERGMSESAVEAMKEALLTRNALDVINEELIPALDVVGQGFEKGTIFLPQLLMSADAAKAAFAVVKESMAGQTQKPKGKIILATVKGDIHDIGKNIVKVMLENYSYEVIDLGKDVPPEVIVDTAIKEDIKLVGLSALMTTTVVSMEETIKLLKEKKPDTLTVVGGAVMTQEYADQIGADAYAKDAMATVRYADSVFDK